MKFHRTTSFCLAAVLLCSCTGESPFLQVQFCVTDAQGVNLLKTTLQDIARDEHMRFIDGSEATTRDLKSLGSPGKKGSPPFSRTLTKRPIEAMRSVHVEAKEVQCRVQAWCG